MIKDMYIDSTAAELDTLVAEISVHVFYLSNLDWWERKLKRNVIKQAISMVCKSIQQMDLMLGIDGSRLRKIEFLKANDKIPSSIRDFLTEALEREDQNLLIDHRSVMELITKHSSIDAETFTGKVAF